MTHKFSFLVLLSVACISFHESWGAIDTKELHYIGVSDNKLYFSDANPRSAESSEAFCDSNNLRLAQITTATQQEFLESNFDASTFSGGHWIGAKFNYTASKENYYWANSSTGIEDFAPQWTFQAPPCLQYNAADPNSTIPNGAWMSITACAGSAKVLCETDL